MIDLDDLLSAHLTPDSRRVQRGWEGLDEEARRLRTAPARNARRNAAAARRLERLNTIAANWDTYDEDQRLRELAWMRTLDTGAREDVLTRRAEVIATITERLRTG